MTKSVHQDAYCRGNQMPYRIWFQTYCNLRSLYHQNYIVIQVPRSSITADSFSKIVMYIGRCANYIEWFISVSELRCLSTWILPFSNLSLSLCSCRSKWGSEGSYLLSSLALYLLILLQLLTNEMLVLNIYFAFYLWNDFVNEKETRKVISRCWISCSCNICM